MSRMGKIPVKIPAGVKVIFQNDEMFVEGPKGKLSQKYHPVIKFEEKNGEVNVIRNDDEKQTKAYHGLYRNLLLNMVKGVSAGFNKTLIITGVGFRAEVLGNLLKMNLGYSNEIFVGIPEGITVTSEAGGRLVVNGYDNQKVGEFAAQIRKLRGPEPYKGKGIRYDNEIIRRKVGKSGVK